MTKDKERDDALIAENLLKARIDRAVELAGDGADIYGQMSQFNRLVKEGWQPKPDRAEVLAQALWDQWTLKASEVIDAQSLINDAFNELRAEWEAERPVDSGMSGDAVKDAEWLWVNLPTMIKWTSLKTHEKALVCHTVARLRAERPAVVVPGEVLEQARANRYTPVGSVRIMARFILSLDGAKGGE